MAEYLIKDTTLLDIADAIRDKTGESGEISVSEMAIKIGSIVAGNLTPVIKSGSFTPDSDIYTVEHNMGFVPDIIVVYPRHAVTNGLTMACGYSQALHDALGGGYIAPLTYIIESTNGSMSYGNNLGIESIITDTSSNAYLMGAIREATTTTFVIGGSAVKMSRNQYSYVAIGGLM